MPRILVFILAFAALSCLPVVVASNLTVHYIDIGEGDTTLITYQNWTLLIDSGGPLDSQREKIVAYLSGLNITGISLAIATHADPDHIGQFTHLMNAMPFDQFWVNGLSHTSELWQAMNQTIHNLGIPLHVGRIHTRYDMGDVDLVVLSPFEPFFGDEDKDSIVARLGYQLVSFMFMGDADSDTEHRQTFISSIWPRADVLKLGQHGSMNSSSAEWLAAVDPSVAIISGGRPDSETLERLAARGIPVFRTDVHEEFIDDIIATTDGHSLTIRQASTGKAWRIPEPTGLMPVVALSASLQLLGKHRRSLHSLNGNRAPHETASCTANNICRKV